MERTESFWLSMAKKCEQRNRELDERQCSLHQRLETLKRKISLSQQNTSDSSESCSCCMNMSSDSQSSESLPEESSQKLCPYKPKSSDDSLDLCCENSPDAVTADQICPSKLMDIIKREKEMQQQIKNMEIKEKAFVDTLKRADKMYAALEKKYKKSLAKKGKGAVPKSSSTTQKLLEQNTYLSDQLKDAKLELKQCMENLEGPIARQLQKERRKSEQFQEKLQLTSDEMANRDRRHTKDICNLQKKLVETSDNLASVNEINSNLQKQMCTLTCKCKELQKNLLDQKITEARTLECLVDGTSDKTSGLTKATQHSGVENLYSIARKLSRTITDMSTCATCSKAVPQRLKNTMLGIVSIADVVSKKCKLTNAGDNSNDKRPTSPSTGKFGGGSTNVFYFTVDYSDRKFNQKKVSENLSSQQTEMFIERGKISQEEISQFKEKIENIKFECTDKSDLQNTLIELYKKNYDDVYDTMAFTSYGILEVITKSPVGIIETSTNILPHNKVEVTTKLLNFYNELGKSELRTELTSLRDKISSIPVKDVLILKTKSAEEDTTLRDFINIIPPAEPTPRTLGDPEIEMLYAEIGRNKIDKLRMEIEEGDALSDDSESKPKVVVFQEKFSNFITESFESRISVEGDGIVTSNDTDSAEKNTKKIKKFQTKKKICKLIKTTKSTPSKTKMSNEEECDCDLCLCDDCSPNVMRARAGKIDKDKQSIKIADSMSSRGMESDTLSTAKTIPKGDRTGPHPPDCDCVDCLCNPCASFPADYKTRTHPPGCDCIDCLCTTLPCANFNPTNKTAAIQPPQSIVQPSPVAKCSVPVESPIECIKNIPHNSDCNCDLCKCCECKKGKKPCGACELEHHISTCSCLDCILTCGTRRLDTEKQEVPEQKGIRENLPETELQEELDLTVQSALAEESEKPLQHIEKQELRAESETLQPLQPIENQELRAESETHKKVDYLEEKEERCKLASGDEKTNYKSKTFEIPKLKKKKETHSQTRQAGGCDCVVCNDICDNPNCAQILIGQNQQNDKINQELKDLKVCLDNIDSACAKAEACCKPSKSKYGLLTFRNVVQNLQEKCVEKDKVVSTMIKDMKTRMENNFLCNLLGFTSKESDSLSSSDIYCCICDEKTKIENIRHNPCQCHWKILESSDSTSELSSCSCCTQCEELRRVKPSVDPKTSDESCICSCESDSPSCCCSEKQDPIKHLEEKILDDVCCCSYNESHSKKKLVCMQPNTFQKEIKNAPLVITEMRKIIDALLVKWSNPTCKNVIGYEVAIDGQVKSKIRSSKRTSAIIHSITSRKPITVTVYALTPSGRILPGAKAVFDV